MGNTTVITVRENQTIKEAIAAMTEKEVDSLVVLDAEGKPCGIVSLDDILAVIVSLELQDASLIELITSIQDKPIKAIMKQHFTVAQDNTSMLNVAAALLHQPLIPVVDEKKNIMKVHTQSDVKQAFAKSMGIEA